MQDPKKTYHFKIIQREAGDYLLNISHRKFEHFAVDFQSIR